jgi:hypothetical protein
MCASSSWWPLNVCSCSLPPGLIRSPVYSPRGAALALAQAAPAAPQTRIGAGTRTGPLRRHPHRNPAHPAFASPATTSTPSLVPIHRPDQPAHHIDAYTLRVRGQRLSEGGWHLRHRPAVPNRPLPPTAPASGPVRHHNPSDSCRPHHERFYASGGGSNSRMARKPTALLSLENDHPDAVAPGQGHGRTCPRSRSVRRRVLHLDRGQNLPSREGGPTTTG